jgi:signal transduction histidine kinase
MEGNRTPATLLAAGDSPEEILALHRLLNGPEVEVLITSTMAGAHSLLAANQVAVAVIFAGLADGDGIELVRSIRSCRHTQEVIVILVGASVADQQAVRDDPLLWPVDLVPRPVDLRYLRNKAEFLCRLRVERRGFVEALRQCQEVMASVAHDLRNPLSVVLLTARMLVTAEGPAVQPLAAHLQSSGLRMLTIIEDLSGLIQAKRDILIPAVVGPLHLAALVRKIVHSNGPHHASPVHLQIEGDLSGHWDEARLEQIVTNLINSAVRYAPPGARVDFNATCGPTHLLLAVHYQGRAPPGILSVPSPGTPAKGGISRPRMDRLSLSSYIVHTLVAALGGEFRVDSTDSSGTTLRVCIPIEGPPTGG